MSAPSERDREIAARLAGRYTQQDIATALAQARAEGYAAGIEDAARECEAMPTFTEREKACAAAIRALAEKGEQG